MKWFRSNIGSHVRIALFALFVQLVFSFGHFHGVVAESTSAARSGVGAAASGVAASQPIEQPASDHGPGEHPNDLCAICAVMAMAQAALFATAPVLLPPHAVELSYLTADGEVARFVRIDLAFQPRAPPIS